MTLVKGNNVANLKCPSWRTNHVAILADHCRNKSLDHCAVDTGPPRGYHGAGSLWAQIWSDWPGDFVQIRLSDSVHFGFVPFGPIWPAMGPNLTSVSWIHQEPVRDPGAKSLQSFCEWTSIRTLIPQSSHWPDASYLVIITITESIHILSLYNVDLQCTFSNRFTIQYGRLLVKHTEQ